MEGVTSLIAQRQKLLKLADRSEWGWAVVEEFVEDDLADDSGDEKRMERAELAAGRSLRSVRQRDLVRTAAMGEVTIVYCSLWGEGSYSCRWLLRLRGHVWQAQLGRLSRASHVVSLGTWSTSLCIL